MVVAMMMCCTAAHHHCSSIRGLKQVLGTVPLPRGAPVDSLPVQTQAQVLALMAAGSAVPVWLRAAAAEGLTPPDGCLLHSRKGQAQAQP